MDETLGKRVHREFCWFTLVLLALLIACVDRLGSHMPSSTGAGETISSGAAQPGGKTLPDP
jgi:uncharacterized membrane protein